MRFGASSFIWVSPFSTAEAAGLAARVAGLGFDIMEICIEDPAQVDGAAVRAAAEAEGLQVSVCGAFGPDRDVSHDDPAMRRAGVEYLRTCIDLAVATGSPHVVGPMYSATGKARLLPDDERERQRGWAAEGLREAGEYAAEHGIRLGMEPLNRFETDLVNTTEQGLDLCARIGLDNVGLLLDTFHMNIEEKDVGAAIRAAGDRIVLFHACENDRGTPGAGHVDWATVADALADAGYDGDVVIESFTPEIQEIARAVSTWRPVAASGDALAGDGLRFLRERLRVPVT
ncbi:MAG: sugar phosphate isomerase [Conexibacter sp.]|jgi:D-psicose/D-tagatose/L-ribulose 3-epimerase|nr:sugar phosphate isomerase [Conexibacter sp.]MDX6716181.1 D-psicose/D-tagatose/L-ribulose 3-epimerase [Baekduia sp.]MDX6733704.1 D-psicose/D-tagatose/L-ribulose 3-epimerase [Baekduia sp.]